MKRCELCDCDNADFRRVSWNYGTKQFDSIRLCEHCLAESDYNVRFVGCQCGLQLAIPVYETNTQCPDCRQAYHIGIQGVKQYERYNQPDS